MRSRGTGLLVAVLTYFVGFSLLAIGVGRVASSYADLSEFFPGGTVSPSPEFLESLRRSGFVLCGIGIAVVAAAGIINMRSLRLPKHRADVELAAAAAHRDGDPWSDDEAR